jgi:hypothetical protein
VIFLTLTVFMTSLSPGGFFSGPSRQNRVDGIIHALEIIDGASCANDSGPLAPRSSFARALLSAGHCADISFVSHAGGRKPAHDFAVPPAPRAGGLDTVARE